MCCHAGDVAKEFSQFWSKNYQAFCAHGMLGDDVPSGQRLRQLWKDALSAILETSNEVLVQQLDDRDLW